MSGRVTLEDGAPLAEASVSASSPSDSKGVKTDASGYFVFISLAPGTYTITVSKSGYDTVSRAGIRVIADNTHANVNLQTRKTPRTLAVIPVGAGFRLVRPGTTADVYSVDAATSEILATLGGGGGSDNIYSALASVPGVNVPPHQTGWFQQVFVRGNDFDKVGYEYDGIPVNRSFDNYPTSTGSSLGQQELQVYTGGAPANAETQGLAGFINQVVKSGTYPGSARADLAIGTPSLYNKLNLEIGGANPGRTFSYYLGIGGYELAPRLFDNFNGSGFQALYGAPFDIVPCPKGANGDSFVACYANRFGPGGYILGPPTYASTAKISDRETVLNLHFGIPHRRDSGKDDIQFLYSTSLLPTAFYSSPSDWGLSLFKLDASLGGCVLQICPPLFIAGFQYNGVLGQPLPEGCPAPCNVVVYRFPNSNAAPFAPIPANQRDRSENGQGIGKIQFQHNIGSKAYFRIYAYSYYSWWFLNGPNSLNTAFVGCCPPDYELATHTRGASASYVAQLTPRHLVNIEASVVTATTIRDNNFQMLNFLSFLFPSSLFAVLVDANAPRSGFCFKSSGALGSCEPFVAASGSPRAASFLDYGTVFQTGVPSPNGQICDPGVRGIPAGPCEWLVVDNGPFGLVNTVKPTFRALSITDQFRSSDKLQLNLGMRVDRYRFAGADTSGGTRDFWFNAWNQNECVSTTVPASVPVDKAGDLGISPAARCPAGYASSTMVNVTSPVFTYTEVQPRIGATYQWRAGDVLRLSYGKYAEPPDAASVQFNSLDQNLPQWLAHTLNFYSFGFNTPGHRGGPEVSFNLDFSWEHRFRRADASFKLTPFRQRTQGQYQYFLINPKLGYAALLPTGSQTNEGVEFELQKGDFAKNGLSALLSYTYTHSSIKYAKFSNGTTVLTAINDAIRQYNGYTSYCAAHPGDTRCGLPTNGAAAAPCYTALGTPDPACAPNSIANPYWKALPQGLFDEGGSYVPYDLLPNSFNASASSFEVPHVASLILNYRRNKWAVSPALQFFGGGFYGAPLQSPGIDPAFGGCAALSSGSTAGDPRYPFGAVGGRPYDAMTCPGNILIPNPFTGRFDQLGVFRQPNQLLLHIHLTYQATTSVAYAISAYNVIDKCWGGTTAAWTRYADRTICAFNAPTLPFVGNFYNPDSRIQRIVQYPYAQQNGLAPMAVTIEAKINL